MIRILQPEMILIVQPFHLSKVTELRWDGSSELINVKLPESATINK